MSVSPAQGTRYALRVVRPAGFVHSEAFAEVADAIESALDELGRRGPQGGDGVRDILLGWNLLRPDEVLPADTILYNLEQVSPDSPWFPAGAFARLAGHEVWDYSATNVRALAAQGIPARHVPVGYSPTWSRIERVAEDIDVLFYGGMNERRWNVTEALEQRGATVGVLTDCYGVERDGFIARARIVLNMHYYEARNFETVRVAYLLANGRFVVSETGSDPALEAPYAQGLAFAPYEQLVDTCMHYLHRRAERRAIAQRGYDIIRARPMTASLREVLAVA